MHELHFANYANRYSGATAWVVGSGPTQFDYANLAEVEGPVFFINHAVSQSRWVSHQVPSFFFAHDEIMHGEFEKTHCIVVIPSDYGNLAKHRALARRVILYRNLIGIDAKSVLRMRREELAQRGELYISRLGTINSLLHFAWYLGCAEVNLIGCEGTAIGYDPRIGVAANKTHPFGQLIRREQEEVLNLLGFRWRYLGSPPVPTALDQPLVLLMKVQAKPARLKCVLAEVRRLIADSFSKPGCRGVWLYQDYHSYHSLVVVSHWDNDAALVDYLRTDPIRSFRRVCREWLETAMKLNMLSALNIPEHYEAG